jgi:hypothetical protein
MVTVAQVDEVVESGVLGRDHSYVNRANETVTYHVDISSWEEVKYELGSEGVDTPIGRIARVDEYGGEGMGDDYWVVVSVTQPDGTVQYFRRTGWYASHDGGYLDNETEEVEAFEKTVTDYRSL